MLRFTKNSALMFFITAGLVAAAEGAPLTSSTGPGGVSRVDVADSLQLWLEADSVTSLGDGASFVNGAWSNRAVFAGAASDPVLANTAPTFESGVGDLKNGNPVFDFSGRADSTTGDVLTGSGTFTAEKTLFIVARQEAVSSQNSCCQGGIHAGENSNGLGPNGGSGTWHTDWGGAGTPSGSPAKLGSYGVFSGTFIGVEDDPGSANLFVDGVGPLTNSGVGQGVAGSTYLLGSRAADGNNLGRFFDGTIGEVAVFNGVLSTAERVLAENYLSAKWDISLNSGGGALDVYSGDDPGTDYDLDVFGVGSDGSASVLNSGVAGFGLEAVGSSLGTGEYVLAGHNVQNNSIVGFEIGLFAGSRSDRVWFVDTNGNSVEVTVGFDFSDAGVGGAFNPGDDFTLLRASSTSLDDWQIVATASSVVGDLVTFTLAEGALTDGFFTIGINAGLVPEPSSAGLVMALAGLIYVVGRRKKL